MIQHLLSKVFYDNSYDTNNAKTIQNPDLDAFDSMTSFKNVYVLQ